MSEVFSKSLKLWALGMLLIGGITAASYAKEYSSFKPMFGTIICFGLIFICSKFISNIDKQILTFCIAILAGIGFLSAYVPDAAYILFAVDIFDANAYLLWAASFTVAGIPLIMTLLHFKDD